MFLSLTVEQDQTGGYFLSQPKQVDKVLLKIWIESAILKTPAVVKQDFKVDDSEQVSSADT